MEKQIVPNAREEIKKLQEALKTKSEDPGSADNSKGTRNSRQELEAGRNPDEQTADNFAAAQANKKKPKR